MDGEKRFISAEEQLLKIIPLAIVGLFGLILILNTVVIVNVGQRGVLVTLGNTHEVPLKEGLHFKVPFIQDVRMFDVKVRKFETLAGSYSKDIQTVEVAIALNYHLSKEEVVLLYKEIGTNYEERIIQPAIQESVKASIARYTAQELVEKREEVKEGIRIALNERLAKTYLAIDEFSITNYDFSDAYEQAIEAKQTAQQNALKAENDLKRIEIEAQQTIEKAKAEAEAIRIQAQAINSQGGADYVQLQAIAKWNGVLPAQMIPNATVPFLDLK